MRSPLITITIIITVIVIIVYTVVCNIYFSPRSPVARHLIVIFIIII